MASGLGKRFGSNKLMASFHGAPLIHSVLDVTGSVPLFADRLVVTRSREVHDYWTVPGDSGADSYTSQSERGALPGTYTHVKKAPGFIRLSLCTRRSAASASTDTGTDMPALSRCKISPRHSESVFPDSDFSILKSKLPQNSGIAEKSPIIQLCSVQMTASPEPSVSTTVGSPILFDRVYFDELLHLPEKAGGSHVLRQHPDVVQYVTAEVPEELMDVDTPEELKRLENLVTIE